MFRDLESIDLPRLAMNILDRVEELRERFQALQGTSDEEALNECMHARNMLKTEVDQLRERILPAVCQELNDIMMRIYAEQMRIHNEQRQNRRRVAHSIRERLRELCRQVPNEHQVDNIYKVMSDQSTYERSYLTGYVPETNPRNRTILGTFTVKGALRKGERQVYGIKFYKDGQNEKGSFWCNCPDHKFNATKKNIVCKHIVFLVARVGKILDPTFFNTKHLTPEQHAQMVAIAERLLQTGVTQENDSSVYELLNIQPDAAAAAREAATAATRARFHQIRKLPAPEDPCPVCYEEFGEVELSAEGTHPQLVSCPQCQNCFHRECMSIWMDRVWTCVMCRSPAWEAYARAMA